MARDATPGPARPPRAAGPLRTCIATREVRPVEELVRLVAGPDGVVEVDYRARLGGRGAWVVPRRDVVMALERRPGPLSRALERDDLRADGLLERVRAANERAMLDLLALAARSGALASGGEVVRAQLHDATIVAAIVASDASPRTIEDLAGRRPDLPRFVVPLDREALGHRIGKGARAVVLVRTSSAGRSLRTELRRMDDLR